MNKERRTKIARAEELIAEAVELLTEARDEEEKYFENMPESIQSGPKGEETEEMIQKLCTAIDALEEMDLET